MRRLIFVSFLLLAALPLHGGNAAEELGRYSREMKASGRRLLLAVIPPSNGDDLPGYRELLKDLRAAGTECADLEACFAGAAEAGEKVWCATDTHPAPAAIMAAAEMIAGILKENRTESGEIFSAAETETVAVSGNLAAESGAEEILEFVPVRGETVVDMARIAVVGDSNALIYHDGTDLPVRNAGFADHLALFMNEPVTLTAIRGASADPLRGEIYRQWVHAPEGRIAKMEVMVLVLAAEQFADGVNRWQRIPAPGIKMESVE